MNIEDYPDCVYCGARIYHIEHSEELLIFHCACGESVEMDISDGKEELLPAPRGGTGCRSASDQEGLS